MTDPIDAKLLALLEDRLADDERLELLDRIAEDPDLLADLEKAAAGLTLIQSHTTAPSMRPSPPARRGVPAWWVAAAAAIAVVVTIPLARIGVLAVEPGTGPEAMPTPETSFAAVRPEASEPSFMIVYEGIWPDRAGLAPEEVRRRAGEYWDYAIELAEDGLLVAAGDARFEGGQRVTVNGPVRIPAEDVGGPAHFVGILTIRVDDYDTAVEIAQRSPHLRYGGRVTVREVGLGFVSVPGMDDWARTMGEG